MQTIPEQNCKCKIGPGSKCLFYFVDSSESKNFTVGILDNQKILSTDIWRKKKFS